MKPDLPELTSSPPRLICNSEHHARHDMPPGKQWLVVDRTRGIDQLAWITARAKRDLGLYFGANSEWSTRASYAAAVAKDFDQHWARDITMYSAELGRMETVEEATKRTAGQYAVRVILISR